MSEVQDDQEVNRQVSAGILDDFDSVKPAKSPSSITSILCFTDINYKNSGDYRRRTGGC